MDAKYIVSDLLEKWNAGIDSGRWPVEGFYGAFSYVSSDRFGILLPCVGELEKTVRRGQLKLEPVIIDQVAFVQLSCGDRALIKAMPWLCFEALSLCEGDSWRADAIGKHIKDWAKLLRSGRDNEATGVAGELFVMHALVREYGEEAWSWWVGPQDGIHDIVSPDFRIEVKTMLKRAGWQVSMHGLHQAEPEGSKPLYFDCVRLERASKGGYTLNDLFKGVPSGIFPQRKKEDLAKKGDLDGPRFRFLEAKRFEVNEGFPKVQASDFSNGMLPARVISVEYTVDLGGIDSIKLNLNLPE